MITSFKLKKRIAFSLSGGLLVLAPVIVTIQSRIQARTDALFDSSHLIESTDGAYAAFDDIIVRAADKYDIDPLLIKAVIMTESSFDPTVRSRSGAQGLMQLMPKTARLLGVRNILDPEENIMAGTRFLRDMLRLFNYDLTKALAAYNAGPSHVKRYGAVPPFKETRRYVIKVVEHYRYFRTRSITDLS